MVTQCGVSVALSMTSWPEPLEEILLIYIDCNTLIAKQGVPCHHGD